MAKKINITKLKNMATILRSDSLKSTTHANSGHPTSCLSCAEIMSVLYFDEMKYDITNPKNLDNDEFIMSKGHAAPILYSALFHAGALKENLLNLRKFGSMYEGHPSPSNFPWAKVASGSLGQGLSVGVGMALASKLQKKSFRTYVLCGDGEVAEGSIYEALASATQFKLNNLCVIVDINKFGLAGPTREKHNLSIFENRFKSFGCHVIRIDGHSILEIKKAFSQAKKKTNKPTVILAKTLKGKGISFIEDKPDWHGKVLSPLQLENALGELPKVKMPKITITKPKNTIHLKQKIVKIKTKYFLGEKQATRVAYGAALKKIAKKDVLTVAVDAEVKHSTFSETIEEVDKNRFIEAYIAEQNMVGMSIGLSIKNMKVFTSTFAAFFSRAHDQIRIAGMSHSNLTFVGSHAGVSIGEDGPTQMALEDIALFRALPQSYVFYPSDAVSTEKIMELTQSLSGVKYIRTSRPKTPVIYADSQKFKPGDFNVIKESKKDKLVLLGAGITLEESMIAAKNLAKQNISVAVIDCYSIQPFNAKKFLKFVQTHGKKVIVTEDHYAPGGMGEMISAALSGSNILVKSLCVKKTPRSGTKKELLAYESIDAASITRTTKIILKK